MGIYFNYWKHIRFLSFNLKESPPLAGIPNYFQKKGVGLHLLKFVAHIFLILRGGALLIKNYPLPLAESLPSHQFSQPIPALGLYGKCLCPVYNATSNLFKQARQLTLRGRRMTAASCPRLAEQG